MSNYCACSGGDEEYTIELNQQGPEGPQGPVGPEGFSPSISVKTNTDKAYVLTVVNKEGTFDTPNLYGETEKLNADLSNIPNPAYINGVSLSSIEDNISMITMDSSRITTNVDGNLILNATASNEETMEVFNYEVVANPKEQRLELHDNEGNVKIVATTDYIPTIGVATTTTAGVVKPDGSTITVTPDGTISVVGGGGDVTAAGNNRFTGDNTFTGKVNIAGGALTVEGLATLNQAAAQYLNAVSITSSGEINATSIKANGLRSDDIQTTENKKYLTEVDVDNQTIQIVNGKLHANIDELGNEVNDLSDRVTTLQTSKQDTLTAGANITIVDNVISATGGGGGGASIDDSTISTSSTWSSSKINSEITTVADTKNDNIFDINKFTVVGSPTITDDGIASNLLSPNSTIKTLLLTSLQNKSWIMYARVLNATTNWRCCQVNGYDVRGSIACSKKSNGDMALKFYGFYGDTESSSGEGFGPAAVNIGQDFSFLDTRWSFDYSTGLYELYYKKDGIGDWVFCCSYTPTTANKQLYDISVGGSFNQYYVIVSTFKSSEVSFDLSHFSITVDGKEVFNGLMESTKPIYDRIATTSSALTTFQTDTDNNFSAVNSALNEKANLSDLAGYVPLTKYNELLARVVALETEINGGNA